MHLRTALLAFLLVLLAVFVVLNWTAISAPTALSLGVATVQAPLGVVLLGMVVVLTLVFAAYMAFEQLAVLQETRRQARALEESRRLADEAEASRFTELRRVLETEVAGVARRTEEAQAALVARIDRLEGDLRGAIEQGGTTMSAYIGELEDRMERLAGKRPPGEAV
jgi:uncharacterized integral membrane protein